MARKPRKKPATPRASADFGALVEQIAQKKIEHQAMDAVHEAGLRLAWALHGLLIMNGLISVPDLDLCSEVEQAQASEKLFDQIGAVHSCLLALNPRLELF